MSDRTNTRRVRLLAAVLALAGCLGWLAATGSGAARTAAVEQTSASDQEARTAAGQAASAAGTLLRRVGSEKSWKVVRPKETVSTGDVLLALPGTRAEVDSKGGAVRLTLVGNLPELSFIPVLESAVVLNRPGKFDLAFTLDRGRVILTNRKRAGSATVRVRFRDEAWDVTLDKPGAEVALERFGRWLRVPPVTDKPKPEDQPDANVILIVLKGDADLSMDSTQYSLRAPPGPALFAWDTRQGPAGPRSLKELPPWAKPEAARSPEARATLAAADRLRAALEDRPVAAVLAQSLQSKEAAARVLAVHALGATDDLSGLLDALENKSHPEVRLAALDDLRHWIGRSGEHPSLLYQTLLKRKYTAGQAKTFIQLLHSFTDRQLARPETYELLIDYLKNDRLGIRELAYWHLLRLVPEGRSIRYDPAGDTAQINRAYAEWKKLVPTGSLPRPSKPKKTGGDK